MRDSPRLGMGGSTHCVPAFAQASTLTKRRIERERERGRKRAQAKNAGKSPQCVVLLRTAWTRGNIEDPSPSLLTPLCDAAFCTTKTKRKYVSAALLVLSYPAGLSTQIRAVFALPAVCRMLRQHSLSHTHTHTATHTHTRTGAAWLSVFI